MESGGWSSRVSHLRQVIIPRTDGEWFGTLLLVVPPQMYALQRMTEMYRWKSTEPPMDKPSKTLLLGLLEVTSSELT